MFMKNAKDSKPYHPVSVFLHFVSFWAACWLSQFLHDLIYFNLMKLAGKEPCKNYKSSSKSLSCTYNRYPRTSFVKPVTQSSV